MKKSWIEPNIIYILNAYNISDKKKTTCEIEIWVDEHAQFSRALFMCICDKLLYGTHVLEGNRHTEVRTIPKDI